MFKNLTAHFIFSFLGALIIGFNSVMVHADDENPYAKMLSRVFAEATRTDQSLRSQEEALDREALKYANKYWIYDPKTHSFFDRRTGWRSYWVGMFKRFRTIEGYFFDYKKGVYYDYDSKAILDPSVSTTWEFVDDVEASDMILCRSLFVK